MNWWVGEKDGDEEILENNNENMILILIYLHGKYNASEYV